MAEAITMEKLGAVVELLNRLTRQSQGFQVESGVGGYRLVSNKGSVDVSPRMKKAELYYWIHAFIDGFELGQRLGRG